MTKIMTDAAKERERMRIEIYGEWIKMKKKGWNKRTAIPVLADDYGMSYAKVTRMIQQSEQMAGIKPVREVAADEVRQQVFIEFNALREQGYSVYGACQKLGTKFGKHYQTINNWVRECTNLSRF